MSNNLSKKQVAAITQVAHKAWRQLVATGAESGDWRDEQDWRHAVQEELLGAGNTSLKSATQHDYPRLYNHFALIAGLKSIADKTRSGKDKIVWVLQDVIRRHELKLHDLAEIARDKFPTILRECDAAIVMDAIRARLDEEQVMQLVFTANNYGRSKTRRIAEYLRLPETYEPYVDKSTRPPGRLGDHFDATDV